MKEKYFTCIIAINEQGFIYTQINPKTKKFCFPIVEEPNKNRVEVNGIGVKFTRKEYEIIKLLAKHPDRIYTLEVIYSNIWEELYTYNSGNTVMVHIKNIRNKFYEICNRAVIETIWGKGYKFEK